MIKVEIKATGLSINGTQEVIESIKAGNSDIKLKFEPDKNDFGFIIELIDEKFLISKTQLERL